MRAGVVLQVEAVGCCVSGCLGSAGSDWDARKGGGTNGKDPATGFMLCGGEIRDLPAESSHAGLLFEGKNWISAKLKDSWPRCLRMS